jgi:hypothetical protein
MYNSLAGEIKEKCEKLQTEQIVFTSKILTKDLTNTDPEP